MYLQKARLLRIRVRVRIALASPEESQQVGHTKFQVFYLVPAERSSCEFSFLVLEL